MALSDAKSIPIDNAIAGLASVIERLKTYKQLVLAYRDTDKDRLALIAAITGARDKVNTGRSVAPTDLGQMVNAVLDAIPCAPEKRTVQSPRLPAKKSKEYLSASQVNANQRSILYGCDRR